MNATSLQGLVAQLANFESNFIHILTQAALRMSDLSGREIFLLVKSQTGSYFAGSRELCAAYKIGTLMPSSADEVHIKKEDACESKLGGTVVFYSQNWVSTCFCVSVRTCACVKIYYLRAANLITYLVIVLTRPPFHPPISYKP